MVIASLAVLLAFYVAWNLGANDVANSMGTSVGSKALSLKKAILIAGVLEFSGAVLFGRAVVETLATKIVHPTWFFNQPQVLITGMVSVMLACGLWMQLATSQGWPVSSSHAIVGAIAGFTWLAIGPGGVDWSSLGVISLTWILTPFFSGILAACFYSQIQVWILKQNNYIAQLHQWIPWLSFILLGVFGVLVLPTLSKPINTWIYDNLGWKIPPQDIPLAIAGILIIILTIFSWRQLENKNHQNYAPFPNIIEQQLARFQVLSACFVAFAHGSNDVGNAIAPLAVISYIRLTGTIPDDNFSIPFWILILGGTGIVAGLSIWGYKVIATIGENIIPLQPSSGFCAELATATTVLLASRFGLPVSTSHALVGSVVGIGIMQFFAVKKTENNNLSIINSPNYLPTMTISFKTVLNIIQAWLITIPISAILAASLFYIARNFLC